MIWMEFKQRYRIQEGSENMMQRSSYKDRQKPAKIEPENLLTQLTERNPGNGRNRLWDLQLCPPHP